LVVAFQRFICRFRPRKEGYELLRAARCAAQTMEATDSLTDWVWCLGWFVFPRASFVCCGILGFGIGDWGRSDCRFCSRRAVAAGGPVGIPKDAQPVPPVPRPDLGPRMDALCAGRPGPGPGSVRQTHGRRLKPRPEIHTRRRPDPRFIPAKHDRFATVSALRIHLKGACVHFPRHRDQAARACPRRALLCTYLLTATTPSKT
jgi:hypothetical protein